MRYIIIITLIIILIFCGIIIINSISCQKAKKDYAENLKSYLDKLGISYLLKKSEHYYYNYDLNISNKRYLIKLISIPYDADVQINNKTTWEIKFGGGKSLGKAHPNSTYLGENIDVFMNLQTDASTQKIIVVIPKPRKVIMYINECEIIFVNSTTNVYGTKVISCDDFSLFNNAEK